MRRFSSLIALMSLVASLFAIVPGGAVAGSPSLVPVKIAVAAPLTAGATVLGQGMQRATALAVSDYASELVAANVTMTVLAEDDQGDPSVAVAVANAIVASDSVLGVVGHLNSGCSIPASKVYSPANLAMVTPVSTNPALTQQGLNNVFRTCATDAGQGPLAADTTLRNLRLTRAYVVDDYTLYGVGLASGFAKRFKADGGRIVGTSHTLDRQTGFSSLIKKIKAKNPTVVYYGGIYNAGALFTKQLKAKLPNVQVVGGDGLFDPTFVGLAGAKRANGTLVTSVGLAQDQLPGGADFRARFAAFYPGIGVVDTDAYAYDAAVTIIKGVLAVANESGSSALVSPGARGLVRAKIAASNFQGVTGPVTFTSAGDIRNQAFSVWRVKSGSWKSCATAGRPSVATSVKRNVAFGVKGSLAPRHAAGSKAVTLRFYRKVGSKWVLGKTVSAAVADSGAFSAYSVYVKLPKKGSWRVFAEHVDSTHALMDSVVRTFTVK